jgi:hypothetical protein
MPVQPPPYPQATAAPAGSRRWLVFAIAGAGGALFAVLAAAVTVWSAAVRPGFLSDRPAIVAGQRLDLRE